MLSRSLSAFTPHRPLAAVITVSVLASSESTEQRVTLATLLALLFAPEIV